MKAKPPPFLQAVSRRPAAGAAQAVRKLKSGAGARRLQAANGFLSLEPPDAPVGGGPPRYGEVQCSCRMRSMRARASAAAGTPESATRP